MAEGVWLCDRWATAGHLQAVPRARTPSSSHQATTHHRPGERGLGGHGGGGGRGGQGGGGRGAEGPSRLLPASPPRGSCCWGHCRLQHAAQPSLSVHLFEDRAGRPCSVTIRAVVLLCAPEAWSSFVCPQLHALLRLLLFLGVQALSQLRANVL